MSETTPNPPQQPISMLSVRLGPLSLRSWLFLVLSLFVAFMYYQQRIPDISNREYLQIMLDKNTLPRTAGAIVRDAKEKESKAGAADKAATEAKWTRIANTLADCMQKETKSWLASNDPFLDQHLTREAPRTISLRLLGACNAMQYLPQAKAE